MCVFVRAPVCAPDKEEVRARETKAFPLSFEDVCYVFSITYKKSEPSVKSLSCVRGVSSWRASATSKH